MRGPRSRSRPSFWRCGDRTIRSRPEKTERNPERSGLFSSCRSGLRRVSGISYEGCVALPQRRKPQEILRDFMARVNSWPSRACLYGSTCIPGRRRRSLRWTYHGCRSAGLGVMPNHGELESTKEVGPTALKLTICSFLRSDTVVGQPRAQVSEDNLLAIARPRRPTQPDPASELFPLLRCKAEKHQLFREKPTQGNQILSVRRPARTPEHVGSWNHHRLLCAEIQNSDSQNPSVKCPSTTYAIAALSGDHVGSPTTGLEPVGNSMGSPPSELIR